MLNKWFRLKHLFPDQTLKQQWSGLRPEGRNKKVQCVASCIFSLLPNRVWALSMFVYAYGWFYYWRYILHFKIIVLQIIQVSNWKHFMRTIQWLPNTSFLFFLLKNSLSKNRFVYSIFSQLCYGQIRQCVEITINHNRINPSCSIRRTVLIYQHFKLR